MAAASAAPVPTPNPSAVAEGKHATPVPNASTIPTRSPFKAEDEEQERAAAAARIAAAAAAADEVIAQSPFKQEAPEVRCHGGSTE